MDIIDNKFKYKDNPRKISDDEKERLKIHLQELGDLSGVIYCRKNKAYVGGNQRADIFNQAKITITNKFNLPTTQGTVALGFIEYNEEKYFYREVEFTEEQFKKACIVANNNEGSWDEDMLENWNAEDLKDWGLSNFLNKSIEEDLFETDTFKKEDGVDSTFKISDNVRVEFFMPYNKKELLMEKLNSIILKSKAVLTLSDALLIGLDVR